MQSEAADGHPDGPTLIFACSGAADVGAVADEAARRLAKEGAGQMFCLAGVGGRVDPVMEKTQSASRLVAIDGCPLSCAAETLKRGGFDRFDHVILEDLGFEKGKTQANDENVGNVVARIKLVLNRDKPARGS